MSKIGSRRMREKQRAVNNEHFADAILENSSVFFLLFINLMLTLIGLYEKSNDLIRYFRYVMVKAQLETSII